MNNKLTCIVPVYNEEDTITKTIDCLKNIKEIDNIVVVNDGSTDGTHKVLKDREDITYLSYKNNMGKGYAIKFALTNIDFSYLLLIDGDLSETSQEAKKLITPILSNEADFTIALFPKAKEMTNKKGGLGLVKGLAKKGVMFFTGEDIQTTLSGQRVYKKEVMEDIDYIPNRYGIEIAMTIQALNSGYRLKEIPVVMSHRYTDRSIKGFIHRGKQFKDILKTLIVMYFKGYKR